jgi:hypothetical protein
MRSFIRGLATTSITSIHNDCHPTLDPRLEQFGPGLGLCDGFVILEASSGVSSTQNYSINQTNGTPRRNSPHLAGQLIALT